MWAIGMKNVNRLKNQIADNQQINN